MNDEQRAIELEIEVPGTPEEVWQAIATGPGITSWYVPHTVEERAGGAASASFGPGPELQIAGRVAAWEPPHRVVFDKGDDETGGLAFEWLVEAKDHSTCIVRLVNSGFGTGGEWDDQYDAMTEGWKLFLLNLRLHLEHFAGERATPMLPMAMWAGDPAAVWTAVLAALGFPADPKLGARVSTAATTALPSLAGTVVDVGVRRLALLLDEPAPGTAFVAVEGRAPHSGVSVWSYLYGAAGAAAAAADQPRWAAWLTAQASASTSPT